MPQVVRAGPSYAPNFNRERARTWAQAQYRQRCEPVTVFLTSMPARKRDIGGILA